MPEKDKIFLRPQDVPAAVRADFSQYEPQKPLLLGLCPLILGTETVVVKDPRRQRIWVTTTGGGKRFLDHAALGNLLCDALVKSISDLDMLAAVCRRVFRTTVYPGKSKDDGSEGLWLETGMEGFRCHQCGRCCQSLTFNTDCTLQDYAYWESMGRTDIMDRVSLVRENGRIVSCQIWVEPGSRNYVKGCPWLRKIPDRNLHICGIHAVRPGICRQYPGTRKHAEMTGCPGFCR